MFIYGQRCPICENPITAGQPVFGTWGVWLSRDDPLWKFCDGGMHWDCYASWPHRGRFAGSYFEFWVHDEEQNPFWHRAFLDDEILVTVNPSEPTKSAWVHFRSTGSRTPVKMADWAAWLTSELEEDTHPALKAALDAAKHVLRARLPTVANLIAGIDQRRKLPVVEKYIATRKQERDRKREIQRQINPHNAACNRLMRIIQTDGLTCPQCGAHSKEYRLSKRTDHKSAVICRRCGWVVDAITR